MIAAWMLYSVLLGFLFGAAAMVMERFCRLTRLPLRWAWVGGIGLTLLLSAAGLARMGERDATGAGPSSLMVLGEEASAPSAAAAPGMFGVLRAAAGRSISAVTTLVEAGYAAATAAVPGPIAAVAWSTVSAMLLLVLFWTLVRLRRAQRQWPPRRIGDATVLVSRDVGPAVVGLRRPRIVVPAWLLNESPERQELVVRHEDEHRRAGDPVLLVAACAAACILPWNAAVWWLVLRLRLAVELDCDARVLRSGARPRQYGTLLLEIAARTRALPFSAPALADAPHLERRLLAMTENSGTHHRGSALAAGLVAALLVGAACAADLPTAAAIDEMDSATARAQFEEFARALHTAQLASVLRPRKQDESVYFVDGVQVDAETVRGLTPGEIRAVEVLKGAAARRVYSEVGGHDVIAITTSRVEVLMTNVDAIEVEGVVELRRVEAQPGTQVSEPSTVIASRDREGRVLEMHARNITFHEDDDNGERPLIIVDGVLLQGGIANLQPESIERVEIVKGEAARRLYDNPRAAHGVIIITTRAGGR